MVMSATSLSDVSLMAIVPDSECRIPTLIGPLSSAGAAAAGAAGAAPGAGAGASDLEQAATSVLASKNITNWLPRMISLPVTCCWLWKASGLEEDCLRADLDGVGAHAVGDLRVAVGADHAKSRALDQVGHRPVHVPGVRAAPLHVLELEADHRLDVPAAHLRARVGAQKVEGVADGQVLHV